jgi:hypothetical protein
MGPVYKAQDLRLGRLVAIKVIAPGLVADADRRARLGGEEELVLPGGPYPSWTVGRKGIYRIVRSNDPEFPGAIVLTDLHTGKELVVAYLKEVNLSRRHELSLSADETQMLMTIEGSRGADLMMVEGVH